MPPHSGGHNKTSKAMNINISHKSIVRGALSALPLCLLALLLPSVTSCSEDDLSKESVITIDNVPYTEFDRWLEVNYVEPYNIEFKYRFEDNESDRNYYTVPADYTDAVKMAHFIKYLCLEAYDEAGGIEFTRANFPKLIYCIGEFEYRNNGTMILGTAEGGKKILMTGTNYLSRYENNMAMLNEYYFKTIHHEFTHILNQTKDYPADYQLITGSSYVADNWSEEPYSTASYYLSHGFISAYSQYSDTEDFAEMLSTYVITSVDEWNAMLSSAGSDGRQLLLTKLRTVRNYMKDSWGIDIDTLRDVVLRRQADIEAGKVNMTDLSVN